MSIRLHETVRQFMPWSHSKVSLAVQCPKAFQMRYVLRTVRKEGTEARVGTATHTYLEHRLDGADTEKATVTAETSIKEMTSTELETLKERRTQSEAYVARTEAFRDLVDIVNEGREVKLAIEPDGSPCGYNDPKAIMRGSTDHLFEQRHAQYRFKGLTIDHKSGKVKPLAKYNEQLNTYNVLVIQNRTHLNVIQSGIHHVQNGSLLWQPAMRRQHVQIALLPWLLRRIESAAKGLEGFPAKPSKLCGWCDYHIHCPEGLAATPLRKEKKPRIKKDGTPYAKPQKRAKEQVVEDPQDAEIGAFDHLFADDGIIL